jgi:hypothetical protein
MHWVYILRCEEDYYYVGETKRLYTRLYEHFNENGGTNTRVFKPEELVAIYKVNKICNFINYNEIVSSNSDWYDSYNLRKFNDIDEVYEYDNLCAENNIVECLMIHKKDKWYKIRGGKYTRLDIDYTYPKNEYIKELPLCKCGLPCDIKKNDKKNYLFFRCAKKNMWDKLRENFDINNEPCNFFMEYTKDKELRIQDHNDFEKRKKRLGELFKKSDWLKNVQINDTEYPYPCVGGCNRTSASIKLTYADEKRNLCYDCFIYKHKELENKYKFNGKCLIKI